MKKTTVVAGAVASALVLSAMPLVTPGLGMSAFAAEEATGGAVATGESAALQEKAKNLAAEIEKKYPNLDKWGTIWGITYALENQYGCTGKGCAAESLLKNDTIAEALTAAGQDATKMNSMERLEAIKAMDGYDSNTELKTLVQEVEGEASGLVFGAEYYEDYNLVKNLPADFDTESLRDKSLADVIAAVKAIPGYEQYTELARLVSSIKYMAADTGDEEVKALYDETNNALAAVEKFEATQNAIGTPSDETKTPEQVAATNELQKFVDETKKDPTYQKYNKLIGYVRYAEYLIDILNGNIGAGKGGEAAEPVVLADEAQDAVNADAELKAEIVATIKNIGDAMRELGIETDLGKNITTANIDDLKAAIGQAKKVEKFAEYEVLVDAIAEAEAALMSGATDTTELKKALAAVQAAVNKVLPPDTGVAMNRALDADGAIETITSLVVIVALATIAGTAVIAKRIATRKQR